MTTRRTRQPVVGVRELRQNLSVYLDRVKLDGTIVGKFGRAGKAPGEFATIHQMDCRDPDVIFTAEINNWRSQKILLKPSTMKTNSQAGGAR